MAGVRVLVGTRKGRLHPHLRREPARSGTSPARTSAGWEMYHLKGSPVNPDRIYASQNTGWFGQIIQRSDDGGKTWTPVGNEFTYDGPTGTAPLVRRHAAPVGVRARLAPRAVADGPRHRVRGRRRTRRCSGPTTAARSWRELNGLRTHTSAPRLEPGAGGMCLHTIILDKANPNRIFIAISSAGAFRTDDGARRGRPINKGLHSDGLPDPDGEVGHCVHNLAMHPSKPDTLFMQKHWDVMRTDDAGESWREVSGNLPTDFGFPIDVHAHEPETIYVVPITSDSEHFPPDGKLRVYRSKTGGNEWEALTKGLPQENCYVNVLRDAMAVDSLDSCGVYFGTTGGQVYGSADAGDSWAPIVRDLPAVLSVEVQTLR